MFRREPDWCRRLSAPWGPSSLRLSAACRPRGSRSERTGPARRGRASDAPPVSRPASALRWVRSSGGEAVTQGC